MSAPGWDTARLAADLRRGRDALGLTQDELAARSGVSVRTIRDLENGRVRAPRRSSLSLLARALQLEPRRLGRFAPSAGASALPAPPPPSVGLIGRDSLLRELVDRVPAGGRLCLSGAPGVGKSALAAALARAVQDRVEDVLWLDLRGFSRPRSSVDALRELIAAVDPTAWPSSPDEAALAARWAETTRHRRLLVVLDNAADEAQVRPLLPADGPAAVVITSRRPLPVVEPSQIRVVDHLDAAAAGELFRAWVGAERAPSGDSSVQDVVAACDGLPLAVQVAAARLVSRPQWTARDLAARLLPQTRRLDQLRLGDLDVRAALEAAYDALPDPHRVALRRFCAVGSPQLPVWVIAELLDEPDQRAAEQRCDALVDAGLLHALGRPTTTGDEAFAVHDLVRILAAEHAWSAEHRADTEAAVRRVVAVVLELAVAVEGPAVAQWASPGGPGWQAAGAYRPVPRLPAAAASTRLGTDHGAVLAVLDTAVRQLAPEDVWPSVVATAWFWENTGRFSEWAELTQHLVDRAGPVTPEWVAVACTSLAGAHLARGDMAAAESAYRTAAAAPASPEVQRYARLGTLIARSYTGSDDPDTLQAAMRDVLEQARAAGAESTAVEAAINLARLLTTGGQPARAVAVLDEAAARPGLPAMPRARLRQNVADALAAIGTLAALDRATIELAAARESFAALELQVWVAAALRTAARVHQRAGRYAEALDALQDCRAIFTAIGDERWVGYLLLATAEVRLDLDEPAVAAADLAAAEERLRRVGDARGLGLVAQLRADPRLTTG